MNLFGHGRSQSGAAENILYQELSTLGRQLTQAILCELTIEETRVATHFLSSLAEQGWRPNGQNIRLTGLWQRLADNLGTASEMQRERRQMLISALRYTDTASAASRLRKQLAEIDE